MKTIAPKDEARFWSKVDRGAESECWAWKAYVHSEHGYGMFYHEGKTVGAHRFSYRASVGHIPAGMQIDHACHNRSCVNPAHLRLATPKQNAENPAGPYKSSKSGVLGVCWDKQRKAWIGIVIHHGKKHYVGLFKNPEDARPAMAKKRNELFTHNVLDRLAS